MNFEWDSDKNIANIKKHGINFEQACVVFLDQNALTFADERFDYGEERFITLGAIIGRVHVVAHCERGTSTIRIISARKANRREQKHYANSQIHS